MLILNVITLMAVSGALGFFIGKGKIVFEKKVQLTKEQQDEIEAMNKQQKEAINRYNSMIEELTSYIGGVK